MALITIHCKCGCGEILQRRAKDVDKGRCLYFDRSHAGRDLYKRTRGNRADEQLGRAARKKQAKI